MAQPRKHHFLPQFYLREFSADRARIWQIEKSSGRAFGAPIKDTAAIRDFHEIDSDSVDDPHAIEKKLAEIEGAIAPCFREFLAEGFANEAALNEVIGLITMLRMRVPAMKAHIDKFQKEYIRSTGKMLREIGEIPPPPPGLEDVLDFDNLTITVSNWKTLELMFHGAGNSEAIECLANMRITLYLAPIGCEFITSDQPVSLFHPTIKPTDPIGAGLVSDGVEVSVPLSRSKLLMFDHRFGQNRVMVATADEMAEFNRRTIVMADRFVYASYRSDGLVESVLAEKNSFAGFVFKTVPDGNSFAQIHRFIPVQPAKAQPRAGNSPEASGGQRQQKGRHWSPL